MSSSSSLSVHDETHGHTHDEPHDDIVYPAAIPFLIVHLVCFAAIWTGVTVQALIIAAVLYFVRMWALTAGYHRYFSHRSYKTSRVFQFVMAFLGQTSAQRGVLWWSSLHRHHHLHSDTEHDVHSPRHQGFLHSHVGWIFNPKRSKADYDAIPDLTKYPELVWLDRHTYLPAILLAVATFVIGGWPGLIVGFFWSTVVLYHCVFFINSLAHVVGNQRYVTGDDSRNNWWLALITLGEGWHNNHHFYQSSTRQGWRWYEVDISYYVLKAMSWLGLVWDLRAPPEKVVRGEQPLGRKSLEKVAAQLAASFPAERLAAQARDWWMGRPTVAELRQKAHEAMAEAPTRDEMTRRLHALREDGEAWLADLNLPHLPTREELRDRAREMFVESPALDDVAERARELLREAVSRRLLDDALAPG
ncbi:MAG: fatty acid desaturase [Gemmatimonadetes bacterium]|nr:fatty acid desaturase [Gemmatimonadota bacterium]